MRSGTGPGDVDRVREATDLVALIGEHVALRPRGREHVGLCPFHDDHAPSLAVVTHKSSAFYKCHACGAAGDAFTFVMEYLRKDFGEALRFLADRAGIVLRRGDDGARGHGGPRRADLRRITDLAVEHYRRVLAEPGPGERGRAVLRERGIDDAMVERFRIGLAPPGFDNLMERLRREPGGLDAAIAAGLVRARDDGRRYDTFRHRLLFPICDELGHPIALGGRRIDPDDEPKYLNSPESPIFVKSETLYGLHLARRPIIERRTAVVVEGYTDVIACHQAGVEHVVGTLGTALTAEHARRLSRLCDTVVLVFDGDAAGQRAAERAIEVFFRAPVDVRVCLLPDGGDPADVLSSADGAARFEALVSGADDALQWKVERFRARLGDVEGLAGREKALVGFLGELAGLGFGAMPGVRKRWVLSRLAEMLQVPLREIERAMPAAPAPRARAAAPADAAPVRIDATALAGVPRKRRLAERDVLAVLVREPGAAGAGPLPAAAEFLDPTARAVAEMLLPRIADGARPAVAELIAGHDDASYRAAVTDLWYEGDRVVGDDGELAPTALREALDALARLRVEADYAQQSGGGGGVDRLTEVLRARQAVGDLPAAIARGDRT